MPRPKHNANAIPTEERILAAAEQIFGEQGFERSRLEDIAAVAGIRRPSLLYHFKSKCKLSVCYSTMMVKAGYMKSRCHEAMAWIDLQA